MEMISANIDGIEYGDRWNSLFYALRDFSSLSSVKTLRSQSVSESERMNEWRRSLPSLEEVSKSIQKSCSAGHPNLRIRDTKIQSMTANSSTGNSDDSKLTDWREIVAKSKALFSQKSALNSVLTDTFGRKHSYLRISLTERCNLRCLYCMPEEGVDLTPKASLLRSDEIERLARLFALAGVNKIRLTGGEPSLRHDLTDIVDRISNIEGIRSVGITSNGITLHRNLAELKKKGLNSLNISLDTLCPHRFEKLTRRKGHDRVMKTIFEGIKLGFHPVKVNVVVMKGVNDDEIGNFVDLTRDNPINVRFIEYMPFDGNVWSRNKLVTYKEMKARVHDHISQKYSDTYLQLVRCNDPKGEVAKNYQLAGHKGTISFVTSMTSAFCHDCNRLRIMADGNLKVCLFGANEVSLRDALRDGATDDDILAVISAAVNRKKAAHAGMFELARSKNRAMVKIGG